MESLKVSIIVPVYGVEKYFDECIESLLHQTYTNIEVLIIDDGTKDNCGKKADDYAKKDFRVKVYHKENRGLSSARNIGLEVATGDYYCFVDSDDYVSETFVEKLINAAVTKGADMVFCNYYSHYKNKSLPSHRLSLITQESFFTPEKYLECLYVNSGVFSMVWNKIFRKDVFKNLRFADMICEDAQILLSVIDNCKTIYYIPDVMYYYRRRRSGIMGEKKEGILLYNMKWIKDHMSRLKMTNRIQLFYVAQKLYISKIVESYLYCKNDTRKKLRDCLKKEIKTIKTNPYLRQTVKVKYSIAAKVPYLYGKYYAMKNRDRNIYWE